MNNNPTSRRPQQQTQQPTTRKFARYDLPVLRPSSLRRKLALDRGR